jgi:hypothetical protein
VDRETIINMAITAGLDCYANNADKKMDEPLDEMESNYVNKLALFASFVYQYAYAKRDNEALTKNLVAMWPHPTWVGLTDEDFDEIVGSKFWEVKPDFNFHKFIKLVEAKLKEKNT